MDDPAVFGPYFRDQNNWVGWRAFLAALFGLAMNSEMFRIFRDCTGRSTRLRGRISEAWLVIGRRGGKSFNLALIAVFLACFRDWRHLLGPGERATVVVIAADRRQARVILRFVKGLLQSVPMLAAIIEGERTEAINLKNRVTIEIHTASFRTVRGYTIVAALCDEIAFWPSEDSANPDIEILDALRPAMATVPGAMLLCASSPYARRGALWNAWREHYGKNGSILVWRAPTRQMNPTVPQLIIDEAMERDPAIAAAEWMAEFRSDVERFIAREVVEAAVIPGRYELPLTDGHPYVGFVDPSGGSADAMTLSVAHREGNKGVLDAVREVRPPFSPDTVVEEFARLLRSYGLHRVTGDRYAGEWPRERFKAHGIIYEPSEKTKSQIYAELLPLLNSGRVELLDHTRMSSQLCSLERRTARGGRDSIDHAPGGHDDVANAAAGALVAAAGQLSKAAQWAAFGRSYQDVSPSQSLPTSAIIYAEERRSMGRW